MKITNAYLKQIIKEEFKNVLKEQEIPFNMKILDKVMTSDKLGSFKKCDSGGGYVGLQTGCMGQNVAELQALINQWFLENENTDKIIKVDGLFGKGTAQALGFIYNTRIDANGPLAQNKYTVALDKIIAKGSNIEKAIAAVRNATSPKSMVARAQNKAGVNDIELAASRGFTKSDFQKGLSDLKKTMRYKVPD